MSITLIGRNALVAIGIATLANFGSVARANADPEVAFDATNCSADWTPAAPLDLMVADEPAIAKLQELKGSVTVHLDLDADGNVLAARVVEGSGSRFLDQAAIEASNGVKFTPETVKCHPVAGSYEYAVSFGA
jgi:TonB family protein